MNDEDQKKQEKRHQYYINFRNKHKQNDTLPLYYRKLNSTLGRPKKELKPIPETKPNVLHKMIDEIIIKLQQLKNI